MEWAARSFIPVAFDAAWVLATLAAFNYIVYLCTEASLVFRQQSTFNDFGNISSIFEDAKRQKTVAQRQVLWGL